MRVLPADVYDTLEFSALVFGGIGAGPIYTNSEGGPCPVCAHGHLQLARGIDGRTALDDFMADRGPSRILVDAGIDGGESDVAVVRINTRKGHGTYCDGRVSFKDWCAELGVVRGE